MENKINIAEILKNCPPGMELNSPMFDDIYFDYVDRLNIIHCYIQYETHKTSIIFNQHGTFNSDIKSKCLIFPKGKTTWEGFQQPFKDGDILAYTSLYTTVFIYRNKDNEPNRTTSFYVGYTIGGSYCNFHIYNKRTLVALNGNCDTRLATEEEKQKLFAAIKDNGYKWNPETKTLEKLIIPKFKVGDKVKHKEDKTVITITGIKDDYYFIQFYNIRKNDYQNEKVSFKDQDKYELVPNKFDITTLKPFESRVLVRYYYNRIWVPTYWGKYLEDNSNYPYLTTKGYYKHCIPYEGNEHLLGTTNDCDEYYKTWE